MNTSADCLQALIEKERELRQLEAATDEAAVKLKAAGVGDAGVFGDYWDIAVANQGRCETDILMLLKMLAASGALEQCRENLHVETAGRL